MALSDDEMTVVMKRRLTEDEVRRIHQLVGAPTVAESLNTMARLIEQRLYERFIEEVRCER